MDSLLSGKDREIAGHQVTIADLTAKNEGLQAELNGLKQGAAGNTVEGAAARAAAVTEELPKGPL